MILHALFVFMFWTAFFGLVGLVVLGAVALYRVAMTWITGEEWMP